MAEKRRPVGRPRLEPAAKKAKTAASSTVNNSLPVKGNTPVIDLLQQAFIRPPLPSKIVEGKPLPSLKEPQPLEVQEEEYQSISSSGVLAASIERSRQRWLVEGIFERFWTKPGRGKSAAADLPNNPPASSMKAVGRCTITVEPHEFEANVYIYQDPATALKLKQIKPLAPQKVSYSANAGQPTIYGQTPQQASHYQSRTLPPLQQAPMWNNRTLPPLMSSGGPPSTPGHGGNYQLSATSKSRTPVSTPQAKPGPDPVIQMLATRASTDPELKALMKIVATGNANQDQLRIFQRHIDELTAIIQSQKMQSNTLPPINPRSQGPSPAVTPNQQSPAAGSPYGVPSHPVLSTVSPHQPATTADGTAQWGQQVAPAVSQHGHPQQSQSNSQQPSIGRPVLLEFSSAGATPDRFLFPTHSILESIDANTLLASFIITRKGSEAADPGAFDPQKGFYEPITVQISVDKPNPPLLDAFLRSVKAVDEVKTHMVETMRRYSRAPEVYLPLRLPYVGTDDAGKGRQTREASVVSGKQDAASIVVDPQKATAEKEPSSALVTEKRASGRRKTVRIDEAA
ncbi:hypothetical protein LTR66_004231 [Elasticomyces elasticus]|nr:hypothetical protein LTR66_004231 [Elasticomyces elasticus]